MANLLKKHQAAKRNRKKGFTLIEVIVVIVIIAILAAIAVPSLTRYIGTAEIRGVQATAHNIQLVLQAEKSNQNFVKFTGTTGSDPLNSVAGLTQTYIQILEENGVVLKNGETLTNITWGGTGGNTLYTFTLTGQKYAIDYDYAPTDTSKPKGFQEVRELGATPPSTP